MWWMGLTWACLCLPSVVGITAAVVRAMIAAARKKGDFEQKWDEFVNPIAFYASFPISSVIWSVVSKAESVLGTIHIKILLFLDP